MAKIFTITEGLENMGALRSGGQGSVFKGKRMGELISAVKLLPTPIFTESLEDKNFRDFNNEVEKLKRVNRDPNPNVVKILNSGITESGSFPFIEMEYIEGPDLEDLLKSPHDPVFTIKESIKVAEQLSGALSHCHKVDVKHGDIKSNNVKLNSYFGNYVLLDFGLAIMSDEQRRTSLRNAGAVEFMAPEQNEGQMLFESDVYSFGVILYELIAGVVPFPLDDNGHSSRNKVMLSHMEIPVPDILELRKKHLPQNWSPDKRHREMQVPVWLIDIIYKCLEKKPENRFSNGIELHRAICGKSIHHTEQLSEENIILLQSENERLQQKIAEFETAAALNYSGNEQKIKAESQPGKLQISRSLVYASLIAFFLLMGFAGYSFLGKNSAESSYYPPVTDSNYVKDPNEINKRQINRFGPFRPVDTRSASQERADSIKNAALKNAVKKYRGSSDSGQTKGKKKGKKKKFLGIF
ncbi:serine/threonine-protein kinase [Daejeonella oryzae]|uniref:serine/threonine-protein kinase n=1 Tax=Daejeonella oryzae TaxID=1122943 RepID=UPI00068559E0|nr:serine/threonine-protein kinase [Daejeonella oryzae]